MNKQLIVYAEGICFCSVCVPKSLTREEVEARTNIVSPTGINSRWTISNDPFATGEPNPHTCEADRNRQHFLMKC